MVNLQLENALDSGLTYKAPVFSEESNNIYLAQQIEKNLNAIFLTSAFLYTTIESS